MWYRGDYSISIFQSSVCMRSKDWRCARESLRRDRPVGLTSPALHACGSASPFRARCCHRNKKSGRIISPNVVWKIYSTCGIEGLKLCLWLLAAACQEQACRVLLNLSVNDDLELRIVATGMKITALLFVITATANMVSNESVRRKDWRSRNRDSQAA
jgi:hypothetical protein